MKLLQAAPDSTFTISRSCVGYAVESLTNGWSKVHRQRETAIHFVTQTRYYAALVPHPVYQISYITLTAMEKKYITADELLLDSFKLAQQIYHNGFRPHFIVGVWRGGAPIGIAVQEYLDYMGVETNHIAIRTSSYYGINKAKKEVKVHGLDYVIDNVEADEELLIVDDVFDSGRSIYAVIQAIRERARRNTPHTIKVACTWYKPEANQTELIPDFYVNTTDNWLVFPHELKDLSLEEIAEGKGSEIANTISAIKK